MIWKSLTGMTAEKIIKLNPITGNSIHVLNHFVYPSSINIKMCSETVYETLNELPK